MLQMFSFLKTDPSGKFTELEGRMGRLLPSNGPGGLRFEPGVSATLFEALLKQFKESGSFKETTVVESGDFYFKNRVRGTVVLAPHQPQDDFRFMRKQAVRHVDLTCAAAGQSAAASALRISLKKEIPLDVTKGRDVGLYSGVRVKQRTSFSYKMWSFDFTRVWEGSDPADARTLRENPSEPKPPDTYEIEIEFVPTAPEAASAHDDYLAVSMLEKLGDLVRREEHLPAHAPLTFQIASEQIFDESGQPIHKQ